MPAPIANMLSTDAAVTGAQAVLDAARKLFGKHGVDAVSMQDIATSAGVCKANVFHHFANKERLYLEVVRACISSRAADVPAIIASAAPFEQRFQLLLQARLEEMLADEASTRLVMREVLNASPERAKLLATQIFSEKIAGNIAFFEDARQRGELAKGMDPSVGSMLLGACTMFYFNCRNTAQYLTGVLSIENPADYAAMMSSAICTGLQSTSPNPARTAAGKPRKARAVVGKPAASKPARSLRSVRSPRPSRESRS